MAIPVISTITSVNALVPGQFWHFQPLLTSGVAYKWTASPLPPGLAVESSAAFTVDTGADTYTATGKTFPVGARLNVATVGTFPAPLAASTDYYALTGGQLSLTPGGSAIDITTAGAGTFYIWNADTLGMISGFPTDLGVDDVYDVSVIAYDISAGASAAMPFPIGIFDDGAPTLDGSIPLQVDIPSGVSRNPGAAQGDTFDIWLGNLTKTLFSVACMSGASQIDLGQPTNLQITIKHAATGGIMVQGGGPCLKLGSGSTTVYQIYADVTAAQAVSLTGELSGDDDDPPTPDEDTTGVWVDCLYQIRIDYPGNNPTGGDPVVLTRTSRWSKVRIGQDFA